MMPRTTATHALGKYRRELVTEAEYEAAIMSGDIAERALAKERYDAASSDYSATLAHLVETRRTAVLASIAEYAAAPQASAGWSIP